MLTAYDVHYLSTLKAMLSFVISSNLGYQFLNAVLLIAITIVLTCRSLLQRLRFTYDVLSWRKRPPTANLLKLIATTLS